MIDEDKKGEVSNDQRRILLQQTPGNKPVSIPFNKVLGWNCCNNGIEGIGGRVFHY